MTTAGYKVMIMGSGTSNGVPVLGCDCSVCRSTDRRNRRSRASILVRRQDSILVVDTGPEFRLQLLEAEVDHLDAIVYTHAHADHLHGLDDIRPLTHRRPMDLYAKGDTLREIRHRFGYIFTQRRAGGSIPKVRLHQLDSEKVSCGAVEFLPVPVFHGTQEILSYRFGDFAYVTDCSRIPEESYPLLRGLDTLIIGALRYKPHPTHFSVQQALDEIAKIAPKRAYLTHMCHHLEYGELRKVLPPGVEPAYDGLELEIP